MDTARKPTFYVGDVPVYGDSILAPMDGYSDQPFRGLARRLGSAMSYTEFISAMDVVSPNRKVERRLAYEADERPVVFQLYDDAPDRLLQAAEILMAYQPDILDINMGCSSKNIAGRGAGAGLLRTPEKVGEIIRSMSSEFEIPVTAKIRLGWDDDSLNYLQIAQIVEDNGGKLIAVHGRTKAQAYGGKANWQAIKEIKSTVSIPVLGNGDIRTVADIQRIMAQTGCDAVMIGRAAIGNPWIFTGKDRQQVSLEEVRQTILLHLQRMQDFYGAERGLVLFRKHVTRYISLAPLKKEDRKKLLTCGTAKAFISFLNQLYFDHAFDKEQAYVPQI
ncbi:MAG TPA: tRNA dihydrouridine synthase DusB [Chloroflexi bacterium]|nr:tRNA dihydrouridine synthase DusB [Chloroflexota bacterium]